MLVLKKKVLGSESTPKTTTLIISNEDMNDIMKIIKSLQDSGTLLKGVAKTIKNETKEQKGNFFIYVIGYFRSFIIRKYIFGKRIFKGWGRN